MIFARSTIPANRNEKMAEDGKWKQNKHGREERMIKKTSGSIRTEEDVKSEGVDERKQQWQRHRL